MIGKTSRGANFFSLAAYLRAGIDGDHPERVEWVEARNLVCDDLELVPHLMVASAAQSRRVEKPCYHLSVSWALEDEVEREDMSGVADRLLDDLGLSGHQAIIVAHNDTEHRHLHMMINRVHPETGRAWRGAFDYRTIEQSLRQQETERGLRHVPGPHSGLIRDERSLDRAERLLAAREGRTPLNRIGKEKCRRWRSELEGVFKTAGSWQDVEDRLASRGRSLQLKGAGLIVSDASGYAKLSDLTPPKMSVKKMIDRFGSYADHLKKKEERTTEQKADRQRKLDRLMERTRELRRRQKDKDRDRE